MQRNSPLSITAQAGWRFTLRTWKKSRLRNYQRRLGMIYSHDIAKGGDRGWSVVEIILYIAEASRKEWTPGRLWASELPGWKCPLSEEQLLKWIWSDGGFWLLGHVSSFYEGQILTATNAPLPAFLLVRVREKEAGECNWWRIFQYLRLDSMLVGREKARSLMQIF